MKSGVFTMLLPVWVLVHQRHVHGWAVCCLGFSPEFCSASPLVSKVLHSVMPAAPRAGSGVFWGMLLQAGGTLFGNTSALRV